MIYLKKISYHALSLVAFFVFVVGALWRRPSSSCPQNKRTAMISFVAISFDGRIQKAANQMAQAGFDVDLIVPQDAHEKLADADMGLEKGVHIVRCGFAGSPNYFPYVMDWQILKQLFHHPYQYIYCHDSNTAPMGIIHQWVWGSFLIVDFHEWLAENVSIDFRTGAAILHPFWKKKIYQFVEKTSIHFANLLITVNTSIAQAMSQFYKTSRDWHIIRNKPDVLQCTRAFDLKEHLGIPAHKVIVHYVGQLGLHRNIINVVRALADLPAHYVLVLQGTITEVVKELVQNETKKNSLEERIYWLEPVHYTEISNMTQGADIGIFTTKKLSKNFDLTLPNKIFEYAIAGVPVATDRTTPIEELFKTFPVGVFFNSEESQSIADSIQRLCDDKNLYTKSSQAAHKLVTALAKENEYEIFKTI